MLGPAGRTSNMQGLRRNGGSGNRGVTGAVTFHPRAVWWLILYNRLRLVHRSCLIGPQFVTRHALRLPALIADGMLIVMNMAGSIGGGSKCVLVERLFTIGTISLCRRHQSSAVCGLPFIQA